MPPDQSRYQVRLEWGAEGLARLAPSDIVVVVDVLTADNASVNAASADAASADAARTAPTTARRDHAAISADATIIARAAAASGATVFLGGFGNASAVAAAVLSEQTRRAARTSVALIACGDSAGRGIRFTVEDHLAAGAIVDALTALGIDHTSPEAAVAGEAFRGLRGAVRHLLTASGSGQHLVAAGARDAVLAASAIDSTTDVPVLRGDAFAALEHDR